MILRARTLIPISQPPIHNGAIHIAGDRIKAVGHWNDLSTQGIEPVIDLGEVILLPGLVNAHCHLDYTSMAGTIPPQKKFTDWIKLITTAKAAWSYSEFAESWVNGAQMLVNSGTTTVGDIEAAPDLLPELWEATPLRVISFLEMTGVKSRRKPQTILRDTLKFIDSLPIGRSRATLSPHAPYSTVPELLRISAETARRRKWPITSHIAESAMEFEMFTQARGEMFDWLRRNERPMDDCGLGSPVQHAHRLKLLGRNLIAVHVNYLASGDAALLGKSKSNVVHCPRSHAYFGHDKFPVEELSANNVNICLGTDSLATVKKTPRQSVRLNMFDEMRAFTSANREIDPTTILEMSTINGARALGMARDVGHLSKKSFADIIAIPFGGRLSDSIEEVVHYNGEIRISMIGGNWVIPPF